VDDQTQVVCGIEKRLSREKAKKCEKQQKLAAKDVCEKIAILEHLDG